MTKTDLKYLNKNNLTSNNLTSNINGTIIFEWTDHCGARDVHEAAQFCK